jgi:hypothetical protein
VGWVLDHQRDLWADFRAFYGLSPGESRAISGPEYFALAYRVSAYGGVMTKLLEREATPAGTAPVVGSVPAGALVRDVPLGARAAPLGTDGVELSDLIDFA